MSGSIDNYPTPKTPVSRELIASLYRTTRLLGTDTNHGPQRLDGFVPKQLSDAPSYMYPDNRDEPTYGYVSERHQPTFLEIERPRGTTIVDMNQEGQLVVPTGEAGRIATFGLGGCTAVAVLGTFADGSRRAHVQHYDPFAKRHNPEVPGSLEEAILQHEALVGDYAQATRVDAVIMLPGFAYIKPHDPAHAAWLAETIHAQFGDKASVHIVPYSPSIETGEDPYVRTLLVDVPREGAASVFAGMSRTVID